MRRRVSIALVFGLLLCALAARELPELAHLVDNTSNDYSTAVFQKNSSPTTGHSAPAVSIYVLSTVRIFEVVPPATEFKAVELSSPFPDLLHLLCVQRT